MKCIQTLVDVPSGWVGGGRRGGGTRKPVRGCEDKIGMGIMGIV